MRKEEMVGARLPATLVSDIKKIERVEQSDRSTVVRKLLFKAITDWKMEYAAKLYAENKITLERASMDAVVEADEKGRILLPLEIRRRFKAKRFKVTAKGDRLELEPLPSIEALKGKYRKLIKSEWDELEEKAEELVSKGRR